MSFYLYYSCMHVNNDVTIAVLFAKKNKSNSKVEVYLDNFNREKQRDSGKTHMYKLKHPVHLSMNHIAYLHKQK